MENNLYFLRFPVNNSYFWLFMNNPNFSPYLLTTTPSKMWPTTTGDKVVSNMFSSFFLLPSSSPFLLHFSIVKSKFRREKIQFIPLLCFFSLFFLQKWILIRKMINPNLKMMMKNSNIHKAEQHHFLIMMKNNINSKNLGITFEN